MPGPIRHSVRVLFSDPEGEALLKEQDALKAEFKTLTARPKKEKKEKGDKKDKKEKGDKKEKRHRKKPKNEEGGENE